MVLVFGRFGFYLVSILGDYPVSVNKCKLSVKI